MSDPRASLEIGLAAAIVALEGETPLILAARVGGELGLPYGPFDPIHHRTFEIALRAFVAEQSALKIGYVEQLYTFGDRGRQAHKGDTGPHVVSVGYLALTRLPEDRSDLAATGADVLPWYRFFPWEDWRGGRPKILDAVVLPEIVAWAEEGPASEPRRALNRRERVRLAFATEWVAWDEEKVLDRYELLYEAGLLEEAARDGRAAGLARTSRPPLGEPMRYDHRRILATAIARLRSKLKYRPLVFELMPAEFTLTALQRTVEAISGRHVHKQNFRRLVEAGALVEPTGETSMTTGGRPAALYRFRREVLQERPAPGLRLGGSRPGG